MFRLRRDRRRGFPQHDNEQGAPQREKVRRRALDDASGGNLSLGTFVMLIA